MILILDQKRDCNKDWRVGNHLNVCRARSTHETVDDSSFVAVKLSGSSDYYILKNRNGKSGYTVKGELALNQLILDNLLPREATLEEVLAALRPFYN